MVQRCQNCAADDPGVVEQLGGLYRSADVDVRKKLVVFLRHATTDNEQVGGEEHLEVAEIASQAPAPFFEAEPLALWQSSKPAIQRRHHRALGVQARRLAPRHPRK